MAELFMRLERSTTRFALAAAVALLIASVTLAFYQVLTRFVFDAPSTWSEVAARSLMIWCVFMAAAPGFRSGAMMAVEVIYKLVPEHRHVLLETLITVLCLLFLALIVWFGAHMAYRVRLQTLAGLEVSIAWVYAALPVGGAFAILGTLGRYVAIVAGRESALEHAVAEEA